MKRFRQFLIGISIVCVSMLAGCDDLKSPDNVIKIECGFSGSVPQQTWDLTIREDGTAKLRKGRDIKESKVFTTAQFVTLKDMLRDNEFFDLPKELGPRYPDHAHYFVSVTTRVGYDLGYHTVSIADEDPPSDELTRAKTIFDAIETAFNDADTTNGSDQ